MPIVWCSVDRYTDEIIMEDRCLKQVIMIHYNNLSEWNILQSYLNI